MCINTRDMLISFPIPSLIFCITDFDRHYPNVNIFANIDFAEPKIFAHNSKIFFMSSLFLHISEFTIKAGAGNYLRLYSNRICKV